MIKLNLLFFHISLFFVFSIFFGPVDFINLALTLLISYLILNEYLNDQFYFLTANKLFLLGGYYYLVIFPFFYSIGYIQALTFNSFELSLACIASLVSVLGYIIGRNFFLSFSPKIDFSYKKNIDSFGGFGNRKIDSFLLVMFLAVSLSTMLVSRTTTIFLNLSLMVVLFTYIFFIIKNSFIKHLWLLVIFSCAVFITLTVSGSRVSLINIFISGAFLYLFLSKKNLKISHLFYFGIFLFAGAIYVTVFRTWSIQTDLGVDNIFDAAIIIFERNNGLLGLIIALGDIGIAYDNLIYIIREMNLSGLLMGATLIRPLLVLIPRSLWASKPLDTQSLIVEERIAEGLSEFGGGTSQSVTLVGDFFWNFSYFGAFMGFLIFGFLIIWFDKKTHYCNSISSLIVLGTFFPFFFVMWRGAFSTQLIYAIYSLIPIFVLILLHKFFKEFNISKS